MTDITDQERQIIRNQERIENLRDSVARAHNRVDSLEIAIRAGFEKTDQKIDALAHEMAPLNSWMNKGKGALAAIVLVSGTIGAGLAYIIKGMMGR